MRAKVINLNGITIMEEEWEEKGVYTGYRLLAKGNKRRIIDEETGKIVVEYEMD